MKSTACGNEPLNRGTASQFIQERKYLKNVTSKTLAWYGDAFKAFDGCQTEQAMKQRIVEMRTRGVSPISVNSWLRCMNAYFKWRGDAIKIPRLKEEQKVLNTLSPEQIKRLIAFRPKASMKPEYTWWHCWCWMGEIGCRGVTRL